MWTQVTVNKKKFDHSMAVLNIEGIKNNQRVTVLC